MDTPFNMLIVGMRACGKTHYLLTMLEQEYKNHFEYIILISPALDWNKTYQEWKYLNDQDVFTIQCEQDQVDIILKYVSEIYRLKQFDNTRRLRKWTGCEKEEEVN